MTAADIPVGVPDLMKDLGRKLTDRRKQSGMTRAELAACIHYTYGAVLSAENGHRTSSRRFWAAADAALNANGMLLAAADAVNIRVAAAKAGQGARHSAPSDEELPPLVPLPPYRQVQRTNRTFADRLGTTAGRRRRHPHMVDTAARQRSTMEQEVAALTETIRILLRRPDFTEYDVLVDLWQTLLTHDPYCSSFLSAAALMELARTRTYGMGPQVKCW